MFFGCGRVHISHFTFIALILLFPVHSHDLLSITFLLNCCFNNIVKTSIRTKIVHWLDFVGLRCKFGNCFKSLQSSWLVNNDRRVQGSVSKINRY